MCIIWSRQQSKYSLQSFRIWGTSDQQAPLELIEGLQNSLEGAERLAKNSAGEGENLEWFIISGLWRIWV